MKSTFQKINIYCSIGALLFCINTAYAGGDSTDPTNQQGVDLSYGFDVKLNFTGKSLPNQKLYYIVTDKSTGKIIIPQTPITGNSVTFSIRQPNYPYQLGNWDGMDNSMSGDKIDARVVVKGMVYDPTGDGNTYQTAMAFNVSYAPTEQIKYSSGKAPMNNKADGRFLGWCYYSGLSFKAQVMVSSPLTLAYTATRDINDAGLTGAYQDCQTDLNAKNYTQLNASYVEDLTFSIPYIYNQFSSPQLNQATLNSLSQIWSVDQTGKMYWGNSGGDKVTIENCDSKTNICS